jgi:hypothetical protein
MSLSFAFGRDWRSFYPGEGNYNPRTIAKAYPDPVPLPVHHFKWRDGALGKLTERVEIFKEQNLIWYKKSENLIQHYLQHNNSFQIAGCPCNS